jgi:hypothetical protein
LPSQFVSTKEGQDHTTSVWASTLGAGLRPAKHWASLTLAQNSAQGGTSRLLRAEGGLVSRRALISVAVVTLVVGIALAFFVVPPRTCAMDEFECFERRNEPRIWTGAAAAVVAIATTAIALSRPERRGHESSPTKG